jgi:hypothetical protein
VEFRYYALFSVLFYFLGARKANSILISVAAFGAFLTGAWFFGTNMYRLNDFFMYLPFFSFGMAYYQLKEVNGGWGCL